VRRGNEVAAAGARERRGGKPSLHRWGFGWQGNGLLLLLLLDKGTARPQRMSLSAGILGPPLACSNGWPIQFCTLSLNEEKRTCQKEREREERCIFI
jgi:hypothetical protein